MVKQYVLLVVAGLVMLLVSAGVSDGQKPDVQVPVVLDGVRYEPSEFNQIYEDLSAQGIKFWFMVTGRSVQEKILFAFTSEAGFRDFSKQSGFTSNQANSRFQSLAVCISPETYWTYHYEHINCGGDVLVVQPGIGVDNLGPIGWNDRISSVVSSTSISKDVLYKDVSFGGLTLVVPASSIYSDLRSYGWNDQASSLAVFP